jgi:hypothetical protein
MHAQAPRGLCPSGANTEASKSLCAQNERYDEHNERRYGVRAHVAEHEQRHALGWSVSRYGLECCYAWTCPGDERGHDSCGHEGPCECHEGLGILCLTAVHARVSVCELRPREAKEFLYVLGKRARPRAHMF